TVPDTGLLDDSVKSVRTVYNIQLVDGIPRMYRENISDAEILAVIDELVGRWAKERHTDEGFGDFTIRAGIVRPVLDPARDFYD
ncbi:MAG: hypothetical protein RSE65_00350, partial [Hafnia sp.]